MSASESPSMQAWQRAWANADPLVLRGAYTVDGVVLPPGHAPLRGPEAIVAFFQGGFSSVEVRFFPEQLLVADTLAFESGIVRDFERASGAVVEVCDYAITWIRTDGGWKIRFHTWSIPHPGGDHGA